MFIYGLMEKGVCVKSILRKKLHECLSVQDPFVRDQNSQHILCLHLSVLSSLERGRAAEIV